MLLQKVCEMFAPTKYLQHTGDGSAMLRCVEHAELIEGQGPCLQQLRKLLGKGLLTSPNHKVQGAPLLHSTIIEAPAIVEVLTAGKKPAPREGDQLSSADALLQAQYAVCSSHDKRAGIHLLGPGRSLEGHGDGHGEAVLARGRLWDPSQGADGAAVLPGGTRAGLGHTAVLQDEALLLEEVVKLPVALAQGLEGLADGDAVLVAVEEAELVERHGPHLQQLSKLLGEGLFRGPDHKVQGAALLNPAVRQPLSVAQHPAAEDEILIGERGRGHCQNTLLDAQGSVLGTDDELEGAVHVFLLLDLPLILHVHLHLHAVDCFGVSVQTPGHTGTVGPHRRGQEVLAEECVLCVRFRRELHQKQT
mmetsp:Transcript_25235/g.79589  ORF Transcript_25235/g.79589 Transcript_25235/m.79589 type:complete len:362 (-) Transcript_25235:13-1098(-)